MRIALLGGSFDPIHDGHVKIAKTALSRLAVDEVWFLVAKDAPLKQGQKASFAHRYRMVKQALAPYRHLHACDFENRRAGISYTIDTIRLLKQEYPMHTFCFLIGDDQAVNFHRWKDADQLLKECDFHVVSRFADCELPAGMQRLQMELIDVSSTEIRNGMKQYLLCKANQHYIAKHGLYLESRVQHHLKERRYAHSVRVAQVCVELAAAHGLDQDAAYRMGMLHDITKNKDKAFQDTILKHCMPQHLECAEAIKHGFSGAWYASKAMYERDKRILNAIYHHVLGDGQSDYDMILFIADKIEPGRNYDTSAQKAAALRSLKEGFMVVKQEQQDYLKKEGVIA